jgi:hypothetical protein
MIAFSFTSALKDHSRRGHRLARAQGHTTTAGKAFGILNALGAVEKWRRSRPPSRPRPSSLRKENHVVVAYAVVALCYDFAVSFTGYYAPSATPSRPTSDPHQPRQVQVASHRGRASTSSAATTTR